MNNTSSSQQPKNQTNINIGASSNNSTSNNGSTTPRVQIAKLNLNQIQNPYHNCSINILNNSNNNIRNSIESNTTSSITSGHLKSIEENKEQRSPLFTRKNFFNVGAESPTTTTTTTTPLSESPFTTTNIITPLNSSSTLISSSSASSCINNYEQQQQQQICNNNNNRVGVPFTQEFESINLQNNHGNLSILESSIDSPSSSRISRLRKGSLPLPSLHSYREQKIKGAEEMGLTKKEVALQQRNARHFWGTMLIPGLDILKSDLLQVKEESDSRLLLFIADLRRQLRSPDNSQREKDLLVELLGVANSFLALKPNQIECGKYAEDLLRKLNEKDLQGKIRDSVVNLLFIISNFGRIQELLAIETEKNQDSATTTMEKDDLSLNFKGLMNPLATPPASPPAPFCSPRSNLNPNQSTMSQILPPSIQQPKQQQQERLLPPNYSPNINTPVQFNKNHFRTLSYSPKCQSPPFESDDDEEDTTTTTTTSSDQSATNGSGIDSSSNSDSGNLKKRIELKRPSPLSQSTLNQPIIQPPLLSRRIVDLISSNKGKQHSNQQQQQQITNQQHSIKEEDFIPGPLSPEISSEKQQREKEFSSIPSITEQPRILDQSHFLEEMDTFSTSEDEEEENEEIEESYLSSSDEDSDEEDSDDEREEEENENENLLPADDKKSSTNQMIIPPPLKKSLTNPRLDNLKSMTTTITDPITKRQLVRSKSFSPNKFKDSKKQTIGRRKLTRSFSEIPSIKVLETDVEKQMVMCRICEEKINSSLLEEHSKFCAMANQEDMKAMNVEDQLRAIAKILLTRSTNLPLEKRKQLQEFREIAQQAVELGMRDCFKMIIVIKEKLKRMDPNDDNIPLAKKIELLINEKINALRTAEEVINSSPRIFRTSYPRVLISPRNADIPNFCDFKLATAAGRNRSDSDPTQTRQSLLDISNSRPKGIPTIDDFQIIKPITKGGFGKVYLAKKKRTGDIYAIKRLKKSDMVKKNQVNHVKIERDILAHTSNPYVVKMYYSFQSRDYLYLVMEYVHGGDCFSLLQNLGALEEDMAKMIIAETVLALEYLHSLGIIHRDLKPDNLLIDKNGHIKLTDFGLSKIGLLERQTVVPPTVFNSGGSSNSPKLGSIKKGPLPLSLTKKLPYALSSPSVALGGQQHILLPPPPPTVMTSLDRHREQPSGRISPPIFISHQEKEKNPPLLAQQQGGKVIGTGGTTTIPPQKERKLSCVGTPDYLAPEILLGIGHGKAVDWFAVGVILYEFLTGVPPFSSQTVEGTFQNILQRKIKWTNDMSDEARDFIDKLLALNPQSRLGYNGAEDVKAHPFFKDINWSTIRTQKPFFVPVLEDLQDTSYFDARKQFYDLRISDDDHQLKKNQQQQPSLNSSGNTSNDSKFDDFLYVNFQSLSELNHNYLIETNPYVISRRRNSF
ncbi:protein serine/threonine kinase [Cavenderia fasciculata]|uniref:non-specific serine/threonine protein kinase n=1 Tax=Cavenderia fasciculata TaxID=261658 RepID=F4PPV7_CACFS|nr:protein serine/threonine kinase [Cavenderia fasciculata]EGG22420.1 protein serine/threonine kinase [Cavenderia fasciculata]|eukprot:XP_004360271.1 protein serine/threonine kinase [Cavenderia fasciculata]